MSNKDDTPEDPSTHLLSLVPKKVRRHPLVILLVLLLLAVWTIFLSLSDENKLLWCLFIWDAGRAIFASVFSIWGALFWAVSATLLMLKFRFDLSFIENIHAPVDLEKKAEIEELKANFLSVQEIALKSQVAYRALGNEKAHLQGKFDAAMAELLKSRERFAELLKSDQDLKQLRQQFDKFKEQLELKTALLAGSTVARQVEENKLKGQIEGLRQIIEQLNPSDLTDMDLKVLKLVTQCAVFVDPSAAKKLKVSEQRLIYHLERLKSRNLVESDIPVVAHGSTIHLTGAGRSCAVSNSLI